MLTTKITTSIAAIPKQDWESIFPPSAESYHFFKTLEETLQDQFKSHYIVIYQDSQAVCVAPCFIMDYPLDTTLEGPLKKLLCWFQDRIGKNFSFRVLICGCQAAEGKIGVPKPFRADIAQALLNEMETLACGKKISLLAFKDFPVEYDSFFAFLRPRGLHKVQSYPTVELDISFHSFEEYASSLSKSTRKDLKRKFKYLEDLPPITLDVTDRLGEYLEEAYQLYLNTLQKSEVEFERLTKDFLKRISENLPGQTKFFLWRCNGRLIAFDLCLLSGNMLIDEYIGLDYTLAYQYHLYYVTFRDILNWCIANRIRKYKSGALNYDPKKRLDFRFITENIYVKHRNPIMNFFFGLVCLLLKPENFDPILKDLKRKRLHERH